MAKVRSYKGHYSPVNRQKYKGDPTKVIYRSLWELHVMKTFDANPAVLSWSSETVAIPYSDPTTKNESGGYKARRYFPDFWIRLLQKDGSIKEYIVEVKPFKETIQPIRKQGKKAKTLMEESITFAKNSAKWKSASEFCQRRGMIFKIMTENEIYGKGHK